MNIPMFLNILTLEQDALEQHTQIKETKLVFSMRQLTQCKCSPYLFQYFQDRPWILELEISKQQVEMQPFPVMQVVEENFMSTVSNPENLQNIISNGVMIQLALEEIQLVKWLPITMLLILTMTHMPLSIPVFQSHLSQSRKVLCLLIEINIIFFNVIFLESLWLLTRNQFPTQSLVDAAYE